MSNTHYRSALSLTVFMQFLVHAVLDDVAHITQKGSLKTSLFRIPDQSG